MYQLYAAIYEWRNGTQVVKEFSASTLLDVYCGHIETLGYIRNNRINSFRNMLAEIYSQARYACNC